MPESHTDPIDDKLETQKQWNADPCGASTAEGLEPGSRAFFEKVEAERYEVYAPWMLEVMGFERHAGKAVLEIGPGLGTDHARLAQGGAKTCALDLTAAHLELTRRRFANDGLTTRLVRGDAERLPFSDGSFDVVYSFGALHHTPGTQQAVDELHRTLRGGGLAIVGLYHKHSAFYWLYTMLWRGLLRGQLLRKGHRQLLSEIEHRSPGSPASPLVKVFTRSQCRELFDDFASVSILSRHFDYWHALPGVPPSRGRLRRLAEAGGRYWGWYLIVLARK